MKYTLTDERRAHLLLHFGRDDNAGSHFDLATFPNPDTLLASIETMQPNRIIRQANEREAHVYSFPEHIICGSNGIGKRRDYPETALQLEMRNGYTTAFITVDVLSPTNLVTIVCDTNCNPPLLITGFPGDYAPAFPHNGMDAPERRSSEEFWKNHVLLKRMYLGG